MEVTAERHIKSISEYLHLFPQAEGTKVLIKAGAKLEDTMKFIPGVVRKTLYQTAKLAPLMRGRDIFDTCKKIYNWICQHIEYRRERGELVQSPQRTLSSQIGDCEDMTILVCSFLMNLGIVRGIVLRVAMYNTEDGFQHIYPILKLKNGKSIIIDCVLDEFDYEKPYILKEDTPMDLYYLNGVGNTGQNHYNNIDAEDLLSGDLGDLGLKLKLPPAITKVTTAVKTAVKNTGAAIKSGVHAINKVNPATALLRAGLLAAMKMNLMNVAGSVRYAYLSDAQAASRKFDMGRFAKLKGVRERLEKLFHGAGGEIPNLKSAILTGKGNSNKDVPLSGFGNADATRYDENVPLSRILGEQIYRSEIRDVQGLSGTLGEPVTAAALAAATAAMTAISALIKSIGSLKKDGGDTTAAPEGENTTNTTDPLNLLDPGAAPPEIPADPNSAGGEKQEPSGSETPAGENKDSTETSEGSNDRSGSDTGTNSSGGSGSNTTGENTPTTKRTFGEWAKANKTALIIGGSVLAAGTIAFVGYKIYTSKKKGKPSAAVNGLQGTGKKKKKKGKKQAASVRFQKLK